MSDLSTNEDFRSWIGRKTARLARELLDCGHVNAGEVYFHGWCDRLTCSKECAEAEHDCSAFAGVKSGTGEVPEPDEAEGHTWTVNPGSPGVPRAGVCRNCGSWLSLNVPLCPPCEGLPPCVAEHYSGALGRRIACLLPDGHRRDHEDVTGSQWVAEERQVEALRPIGRALTAAEAYGFEPVAFGVDICADGTGAVAFVDSAGHFHVEPAAPPVDELVEPVPDGLEEMDGATCSPADASPQGAVTSGLRPAALKSEIGSRLAGEPQRPAAAYRRPWWSPRWRPRWSTTPSRAREVCGEPPRGTPPRDRAGQPRPQRGLQQHGLPTP